jgi:hypothetical protein
MSSCTLDSLRGDMLFVSSNHHTDSIALTYIKQLSRIGQTKVGSHSLNGMLIGTGAGALIGGLIGMNSDDSRRYSESPSLPPVFYIALFGGFGMAMGLFVGTISGLAQGIDRNFELDDDDLPGAITLIEDIFQMRN